MRPKKRNPVQLAMQQVEGTSRLSGAQPGQMANMSFDEAVNTYAETRQEGPATGGSLLASLRRKNPPRDARGENGKKRRR
jgi:hypothetical protein